MQTTEVPADLNNAKAETLFRIIKDEQSQAQHIMSRLTPVLLQGSQLTELRLDLTDFSPLLCVLCAYVWLHVFSSHFDYLF